MMLHVLSHSVYQDLSMFGDDPAATLSSMGCDGLELLTSYRRPDPVYAGVTRTVHLPYAPDWLAAWEDRPVDMPDDYAVYHCYGRCREELVGNVRTALECASALSPAYGVFHACNADTSEIFKRGYSRPDSYVVRELCEMMNTVVGGMPGGEPPVRVLFENLWWPGLRLLSDAGFRYLESRLEFSDWGLCVDTGHMMSCLPTTSEEDGIERLLKVFDGYGADMVDRVQAVHFHWSATYGYRSSFEEREWTGPFDKTLVEANAHVSRIDRHLPFSDPRCAELLDALLPEYVVHEMLGSEAGVLENFRRQRSLLPRWEPYL